MDIKFLLKMKLVLVIINYCSFSCSQENIGFQPSLDNFFIFKCKSKKSVKNIFIEVFILFLVPMKLYFAPSKPLIPFYLVVILP